MELIKCNVCSHTKPKKTIHKYHKTDEWGKWLICVECGKTMTYFPSGMEEKNVFSNNHKNRR